MRGRMMGMPMRGAPMRMGRPMMMGGAGIGFSGRMMPGGPGGPGSAGAAIPRPPFDLALCEPIFPRATELDDNALTQALVKRNQDLTPTAQEQTNVMNLVTKVSNVLEKLVVSPDTFSAATIEEVRQVGSLKKGTMITRRNVADLAVVLKTLPTPEAVTAIGNKVIEDIKASEPKEVLGCAVRDFGCEIASTNAVVRLLVTTIPPNMKKLDSTLHLNAKILHVNLASVRHARYFEENASHSSIKVLVRLLKDIRNRFLYLQPLNVWMIELLAFYSVMNTPNHQPLPLNQAFRRCFQLLSSGIFLPGSAGILDPCESSGVRIQTYMTLEEQDTVCCIAQTLLRVLCHGGHKQILGMEGTGTKVATEMSVWEGVVVTPLDKAYDPSVFEDKSSNAMEVSAA